MQFKNPDPERYRPIVCGLPWFRAQSELAVFQAQKLTAVYAAGPVGGRQVQVAWTNNLPQRLTMIQTSNWKEIELHELVWVVDADIAKRLEDGIHHVLTQAKRGIRGKWFDVTPELLLPTFDIAGRKMKVPAMTHAAMLSRIDQIITGRTQAELRKAGV